MQIESRDSVSLKPVELDEFSQLLATVGLASMDDHLEGQVEKFPLIVLASVDDERHGFLFGSLERVGGTPCAVDLGLATKGGGHAMAAGVTVPAGRIADFRAFLKDTLAECPQVRAIEIKLSQGAKPGHGGILPGAKVTREIAAWRGVAPGVDCVSPPGSESRVAASTSTERTITLC